MNKIGIITFQDTLNYGASMQCYALQEKLALMGADVEVIDYKCPKFKKEYSPFYISEPSLRKFFYMLAALKMNVVKQYKKRLFQKKYIRLSRTYTPETISETNSNYSIFITGSDQVWNWHLTNFDKAYFLDFVDPQLRKYSYAASFGISNIEQEKKIEYRRLLSGYDAITVREESGMNLVRQLGYNVRQLVVDPVLLLNAEDWRKIEVKPSMKDYILLYSINDTVAFDYAYKFSKETGKKLVYLSAPLKKHGNFIKIVDPGPDEFIGWFDAADYIVTDSFHGVVTSVLFHKQFVALQDRTKLANANSRIWDLLCRLSLTERVVEACNQLDVMNKKINYTHVQKELNVYINNSEMFLKQIIGEKDE